MVETKEPETKEPETKEPETKELEITPTRDNTQTYSKSEQYCAYCIVVFFVVWIGVVIYVGQLDPSVF